MKKFLIALGLALALSLNVGVRDAIADGCGQFSCTYYGYFTIWYYYFFPEACAWSYTAFYDGSWSYWDCTGSYSGYYLR